MMMNKKRFAKGSYLRIALFLPLGLALVLAANAQVVMNYTQTMIAQNTPQSKPIDRVNEESDAIFIEHEMMPEFPGGQAALMKYIKANLRYPKMAKEKGIEGRVSVSFFVEENGVLSDIQIMRGIDPECDLAALNLVKGMPNWIPGQLRGQNVRVKYSLPISFKLNN